MVVKAVAPILPVALYERTEFHSKSGYLVSVSSDVWKLDKDNSVKFYRLEGYLSPDMMASFKQVLSIYAETCSAKYPITIFEIFIKYFSFSADFLVFSPESLISFRDYLGDQGWRMSTVRSFLRTWLKLGYAGMPAETLRMLEKWTIKGNKKGFAVQSMCPETGPLTDVEMSGVVAGVIESYADGTLALRDACYAMTVIMTGRRPVQIASLKIKDLVVENGKYFINFPRNKQKHAAWRSSFNRFRVVEDLWVLLQSQAEAIRNKFEGHVEGGVPPELLPELPLFPASTGRISRQELKELLSGDFLHAQINEIFTVMRALPEQIGVISERTGTVMRLNSYRFRYTLGTNLAREGKGEYIIAEALDHSDTQNTGVYVKNVPEIVERIDKAVSLHLAPLAQAFQGVLVVNESAAKRGSDPASRICSSGGNVGTCGSYGFCGAMAPIACYTCSHFQPWLDGPHELILDHLISDRDNVYECTGDLKIASVNDRLILAVSDVVSRCKLMKSEMANV